jgi:hypothetical protein
MEKKDRRGLSAEEKKLARVRARIERDKFRTLAMNTQIHVSAKFEADEDLIIMRKPFS